MKTKSGLTRKIWTPEEETTLQKLYPDTPTAELARLFECPLYTIYGKAERLGLAKSASYMASPAACRLQRGDNIGKAFRFQKGHVPPNKGQRSPGFAPGRMGESQFRKGDKPFNWKPVGSERLMDGYRQRKVTDTGYPPRDWQPVHRLLWEEANGPIPPGYVLIFADGDRSNIILSNLCLISRADLAARNNVWTRYPRELAEAIQLAGALKRKINGRSKREKQD